MILLKSIVIFTLVGKEVEDYDLSCCLPSRTRAPSSVVNFPWTAWAVAAFVSKIRNNDGDLGGNA